MPSIGLKTAESMYTWWFPESTAQPYGGDMYSEAPFQQNVDGTDSTGDQMS